jgi:hypothetical protein
MFIGPLNYEGGSIIGYQPLVTRRQLGRAGFKALPRRPPALFEGFLPLDFAASKKR